MKRQWTQDELAEHWTLEADELKLLANKTGATRLGFGLLLKAFAYQGRFPRHTHELPATVVVHVASVEELVRLERVIATQVPPHRSASAREAAREARFEFGLVRIASG